MRERLNLGDWRQRGAVGRDDAARILSISAVTVDELRRNGTLCTRRIGKRVLIPVHSIRVYLGEAVDETPAPRPDRPKVSAIAERYLREARRRAG